MLVNVWRRGPYTPVELQVVGPKVITSQDQSQSTQQNKRTCMQKQRCWVTKETQRSQRKREFSPQY